MKPEKLERNHERLQLKEQSSEQRKRERIAKLVAKYADVSSAALVTRHDEAYAKSSRLFAAFTVSLAACLISVTALAVLSLFAEHLPLLTSTLQVIAAASAPIAAITWIVDVRLCKEVDGLNEVIMWRNDARHGRMRAISTSTSQDEALDLPAYEPIWDYDTPEEYLRAKAVNG